MTFAWSRSLKHWDPILYQTGISSGISNYTLTVQAIDSNIVARTATLTVQTGATNSVNPEVPIYAPTLPDYEFDLEELLRNYNYVPPIVLDLDGDGVELLSISAGVLFDMDDNGTRDATGWFGPDDAVLAFDQNGNGLVDSGSEINFQRFIDGAFSDLEGLAFFDTNANGLFDTEDAQWGEFLVWQDLNSDGVSDQGELRTLDQVGIVSISLNGERTGLVPDGADNILYATSSFATADGASGQVGDVFFVFDPNDEPDNGPDNGPIEPPTDVDAGNPDEVFEPELTFSTLTYGIKSKNYRLSARSGGLFIGPRGSSSSIDQRAGAIDGPMIYSFKNHTFGTLSAVVFDMDGDGLEQRRYKKSKVSFDMDGNGARDRTGWAIKGDGFLVIDRNENGRIDDATEMSFLNAEGLLRTGQAGLLALDSNGDGLISADDTEFANLQIWVDANRNGVTDIGEMQSLTGHGIESISLAFAGTEEQARFGRNLTLATTVFNRTNGTTGTVGDIALGFRPENAPSGSPTSSLPRSSASGTSALAQGLANLAGMSLDDLSIDDLARNWSSELWHTDNPDAVVGTTGGPFPQPILQPVKVGAGEDGIESQGPQTQSPSQLDLSQTAQAAQGQAITPSMATKLAILRQDLAAFGGQSGFDDFGERRESDPAMLDYFA